MIPNYNRDPLVFLAWVFAPAAVVAVGYGLLKLVGAV